MGSRAGRRAHQRLAPDLLAGCRCQIARYDGVAPNVTLHALLVDATTILRDAPRGRGA